MEMGSSDTRKMVFFTKGATEMICGMDQVFVNLRMGPYSEGSGGRIKSRDMEFYTQSVEK